MTNVKQQVQDMLHQLPDNCTIEDVQYQLYVVEKIRLGVESIERDGRVSHDEAKQKLAQWLTK